MDYRFLAPTFLKVLYNVNDVEALNVTLLDEDTVLIKYETKDEYGEVNPYEETISRVLEYNLDDDTEEYVYRIQTTLDDFLEYEYDYVFSGDAYQNLFGSIFSYVEKYPIERKRDDIYLAGSPFVAYQGLRDSLNLMRPPEASDRELQVYHFKVKGDSLDDEDEDENLFLKNAINEIVIYAKGTVNKFSPNHPFYDFMDVFLNDFALASQIMNARELAYMG